MTLQPGLRVGPYEIVASLGSGGMGEVYRAKDARLGREVALKVLPSPVAADPDRRTRFEREAQAVAALSHPNIVAIFDTGIHDGQLYLVMELLTGGTLRERLADGTLPVRKAVDVAVQMARGLGAAHAKGIVHRDLKPENVFLLDDGRVKLLDFGLARQAMTGDQAGAQTMAATDPGTVMGTVGYMAPEQVRGQAVDGRTDLFAFGAVLYELVCGRQAFQRDTAADTMTAILTQDPPELEGSGADLPPALDRIIRHCLEKNPNERFQSARDVAFALEALSGSAVSRRSGPVTAMPPRSRGWRVPALVVAVAAAAFAAGIGLERSRRPAPTHLEFEAKTWTPQTVTNARFGPDGETLFFSAARSGPSPSLYTIPPGAVTPQLIAPRTHLLAVSAKGELAVLANATLTHHRIFAGTLSRMTRDGAARPWLEHVSELDYGPDGVSAAVVRYVGDHWQLQYPIGTTLYVAQSGYVSDPRISPDGSRVAFMDHPLGGDDRGTVKVVDTSGRVATLTGEYWGEEGVAWSRDSRTVYFGSTYSNAQFDVNAVNVSGTPVVRQELAGPGYSAVADITPDGRLLLVRGDLRYQLRALLPGDTAERDLSTADFPLGPTLARDGMHMSFTDLSQSAGIDYAVAFQDMAANKVARLGPGVSEGLSPDAKWVAALIPSSLKLMLYPTGTGDPVTLEPRIDLGQSFVWWFSTRQRVLYCGRRDSQPSRCYVRDVAGGTATAVTPDDVTNAILSNDDRTLLIRRASGAVETMALDGGAPAAVRGIEPDDALLAWTPDGRGVIVAKTHDLPAVAHRVDPVTGTRTLLRSIEPPDPTGVQRIDTPYWMPDGRGYAYGFTRELSQIFVVRGIR
jgi:dipeptidyl aminopeptidase/acylaminoacyl peptidase